MNSDYEGLLPGADWRFSAKSIFRLLRVLYYLASFEVR